jgi:phenylpropionate dioxygenase-like ring-hydroxylating dioxygenase large terminal subunit
MYLKNAWYMAAWADELGVALTPLTICELPILLYRKENGDPVAIGGICHHLTPVSKTRSLYHWSVVRNHATESSEIDAFWQMSIDAAFAGQDKPIIEAQQTAMGNRSVDELGLIAIPADIPGGKARRSLTRLISDEERGARPQPGASQLKELLAKNAGSREPVLPVV